MRGWLARGLVVGLVALAGSCAACQLLLPERFAVNAPLGNLLFGWSAGAPDPSKFGTRIQVPPGFSIGLYAEVPRARFLRATPAGDLLVSVPREGSIVLLERDRDGDGLPDGQRTLLSGLNRPHGLDFHEDWLYVAETNAVGRIRFDVTSGQVSGDFERVVTELPAGGNHWTRTLRFGPDGLMYVTVGSSCNVCFEDDPRRAAMLRFRPDGSGEELYAIGLRNAVGFDWRPGTEELYATDNGRDLLGDDFPPCELNLVVEGGDYGWPVANGNRVLDPTLGVGHEARAEASIPPVFEFRAHNAPLGIHFLRSAALPATWRGAALVALRGSWNRTTKDGYKVVSLHFAADGSIESRDFVWGFLEGEDVIGRPVDVTEGADGSIFVSDDYAGAVYRVVFGQRAASAERAALAPRDDVETFSQAQRLAAHERGEALFGRFACGSCHIAEEADEGVVPLPLDGLAKRRDVAGLIELLAVPPPPMPLLDMSESERRDLAIYLLTRFE